MPQLRLYQLEAVKDIIDKKKVLIADDMGLGKCAEAIVAKTAVENRLGYEVPALVTCPASVAQHWEDEARLWYRKREDTNVVQIETPTFDRDLRRARIADFAIISYPTLSYFGNNKQKIAGLRNAGFQYGILDEAHNAKNPDSLRSMSVKNLYDSMGYLAILTGTPVPNTVVDLYMLLSLLEPQNFPINVESSRAVLTSFYDLFRNDPEFVRRVLNDRMLRRTVEDYLHEKVPSLNQRNLEVELEGEHRDVYLALYENDNIRPSIKLIELQKAALDPNLVHPELLPTNLARRIGRIESSVYSTLDGLLEEITEDGKVLVFSNLREGVTDFLRERWKRYGTLVVDGKKDRKVEGYDSKQEVSKREFIRRRFQNDDDVRVLLATTVMDEGVDLTAATDVVHLSLPYTPAAFDQRNRRAQRIGEVDKDNVNVHVVKATIDHFTPTIHEGLERLLDDKRRIVTYLLTEPFSITATDLEEIKNGKTEKSRHLSPHLTNPIRLIDRHLGSCRGLGGRRIQAEYQKFPETAKYLARLYASHWEGFYGGNTANLYARVVKLLTEHDGVARKIDIASGPFSLSRKIGEPVVNVDLNEHMFEAGKLLEEEGKIVPGNIAHQGLFHDLRNLDGGEYSLDDNSFDLAVCSLALHMSRLEYGSGKNKIMERELALREQNRILREGGYSLITLAHSHIQPGDLPSFNQGLEQLGFEVLPFSGFYKGPEDSKFRVYLAGLRKVSEPQAEPIDKSLLTWKMDTQAEKKKRSSARKRKHGMPKVRPVKPEFVGNFSLVRGTISLDKLVNDSFK